MVKKTNYVLETLRKVQIGIIVLTDPIKFWGKTSKFLSVAVWEVTIVKDERGRTLFLKITACQKQQKQQQQKNQNKSHAVMYIITQVVDNSEIKNTVRNSI